MMKFKSARVLPLFYQYLFSYLFVLFIPMFIVALIVYTNFVHILRDQVMDANQKILKQIEQTVDGKIGEMTKIAVQISSNPQLAPYRLANFYNVYMGQNLLDYTTGNQFLDNVLLYIHGSEYIYSSKSSFELSLFHRDIYHYVNWSYDDFYQALNHIDKPMLRPAEDVIEPSNVKTRMITYLVPAPNQNPYGTVMFQINEQSFQSVFQAITEYRDSNAIILDRQGRIVTSLTGESYLQGDDFQQVIRNLALDDGLKTVRLSNKTYYISYVKSLDTQWIYMTLIPVEELMQPVQDVKNRALVVFLAILILGCVFIYYLMHLNYNPLKRLVEYADSKWGEAVGNSRGIDKVWLAINQAGELKQLSADQTTAFRNQMLLQLLKGRITNKDEWNRRGESTGIVFTSSAYFVAILQIEGTCKEGVGQFYAEQWLQRIPHHPQGYLVEMFEADKFALILPADPVFQIPEQQWSSFHQSFVKDNEILITAGIGGAYANLDQLGRSYLEASTAIQYKSIKGNGKLIFFRETVANQDYIHWYPQQEVEHLQLHLKQRDKEHTMQAAARIVEKISQDSTTLFMAKYWCFDVVNTVMKTMYEMNHGRMDLGKYPDALHITELDKPEELGQTVLKVCSAACSEMDGVQLEEDDLLAEMLRYLQAHYLSDQFSIQQMAEHFTSTATNLGRYFKERTGRTISEQVNEMRIEAAKRMLRTTDRPLQDIVQEIGYSDVSSFIRKFKKSVNMTPGEYRRNQ